MLTSTPLHTQAEPSEMAAIRGLCRIVLPIDFFDKYINNKIAIKTLLQFAC